MTGARHPALSTPKRRRPAVAGVVAAGHLAVAWAVVTGGAAPDDAAVHRERTVPSSPFILTTLLQPDDASPPRAPSAALPPTHTLSVPRPAPPAWTDLPVPVVAVTASIEPVASGLPAAKLQSPPALAEAAPRPGPHDANGPAPSGGSTFAGLPDPVATSSAGSARPEEAPRWVAARHAQCAAAVHPAALRERGIEGRVHLRVKVGTDGLPQQVQVQAGSGWRLFDDAALAQAWRCRFQPAMQDDRPVPSWVEYPVRFALSARSSATDGPSRWEGARAGAGAAP